MMTFDVVIAGGGPGGLSAGEAAARAGCSVLILEQNHEIGSPIRTTGGSFIQDLRSLGIPDHLYHPIRRFRFLSPNNSVQFEYDDPIMCVMDVRGVFQFLAERAIEAGATVKLATVAASPILERDSVVGVTAKTPTDPALSIRSKILIDATGYRASMLKQSGVHPGYQRFGVGSEYDLFAPHCDQDEVVLIVGSQVAPAGYAWVFPWGRKRVRVGVGIIHADSDAHPDRYLDALIASAGRFGVNLKGAQPVEYHFGLIPSDGLADPFVGNGIMAVGDAAGQPSALVGEGIRWAIQAGRMAGSIAGQAVKANSFSKTFLSRYQTQWESEYGANLRIASEINKKLAQFDDPKWDRKTELLKLFDANQFGQALQANFVAGWAVHLLWSHPQLLKEGFKVIADRLKLGSLSFR